MSCCYPNACAGGGGAVSVTPGAVSGSLWHDDATPDAAQPADFYARVLRGCYEQGKGRASEKICLDQLGGRDRHIHRH